MAIKSNLVKAYRDEENFWKQKSKEKWLVKGDKNTKFFHASVKATRSRNGIKKLLGDDGIMSKSEASKGDVAVKYFQNLFKSSKPHKFQDVFRDFELRISSRVNDLLIRKISKEEVKWDVFSIKPASSPSADGMTGLFFQHYWNIIVIKSLQKF